jgi:hypothetical protein
MLSLVSIALLSVMGACASETSKPAESTPAAPKITLGNGKANWIVVDGVTRNGATFRFREVVIDSNGWLVMHPFENGKPNGKVYVGATYVGMGTSRDVAITVEPTPKKGDMFIVMLHRDMNENLKFDFVFVDEKNVLDKAVFEGTTMVAHAIAAP